jgi:DNA-directed RNA polymerase specialized sigma24 family protein
MGLDAETVIVAAAQGGSEPAWRQLFEMHFDAVYRFCLALTVGRREMAEETAQQVFVTAACQIGRFDPQKGAFRGWLLGIARNRYMTLEAKERRRRRRTPAAGPSGRSRTCKCMRHSPVYPPTIAGCWSASISSNGA